MDVAVGRDVLRAPGKADPRARWQGLDAEGVTLVGSGAGLLDEARAAETGRLDDASLLACTLAATAAASPPAPFYARPPDAKLPGGVAP